MKLCNENTIVNWNFCAFVSVYLFVWVAWVCDCHTFLRVGCICTMYTVPTLFVCTFFSLVLQVPLAEIHYAILYCCVLLFELFFSVRHFNNTHSLYRLWNISSIYDVRHKCFTLMWTITNHSADFEATTKTKKKLRRNCFFPSYIWGGVQVRRFYCNAHSIGVSCNH